MSDPANTKPLSGRVALITGASRGIGRAVSLALSDAGAHVVIAARRPSALEDLDDEIQDRGGSSTLVQLDLREFDKVDAIGPSLYQRWGKLDILVGNAGILGPLSPLNHITEAAWQEVMDINVTANWHLIRSCDPLLRAADAGRAIFVSSRAADAHKAYWGPYATSKAALEALVKTYARELANSNVRANLVRPGPIATDMRSQAFPGEDPASINQPADIAPLFLKLAATEITANGETFTYEDAN
ncbi:MAG: SDR family NAD(P)-dependent oxidoreductase [Pseudomonadota bacterium]